jgi:hypothetical protein
VLSGCVLQFSTLNICFSERGKKKKKWGNTLWQTSMAASSLRTWAFSAVMS